MTSKNQYLKDLEAEESLQTIEKVKCQRDVKHWLWGDGKYHDGFVFTLDTHDKIKPAKRFPRKAYFEKIIDVWLKEPILFVPKSRQIMASWLFTALFLHDTQFNKGRHAYFQSKKEEDSDYLVQRAGFMLRHQPSFLFPEGFNPNKDVSYCNISFKAHDSSITGIPEGADKIRSRVPTLLLMDEAAFMAQAREAWEAAKPCVERVTVVSSANAGFFQEMIEEK